ncbi:RHS repeat-associated core domain-containing protein [Terribacillus saccharophilus]|uniref:RHS repeat-associated core domain-containing protein n=1 Tax=Terribacillus saccharophilus TaxID=361277 RepID=A0AAX2EFC4_9BACI|nr:RHS repeat-associated core domain-containing protein [Terribacillus saccharophilus]
MSDSNIDDKKGEATRSEAVTYELNRTENGYTLQVSADPEWLKSKERKYPIYIDPTTSINMSSDAFVMSAYPTTNYSTAASKWESAQNAYVLKAGYYDGSTGTTYGYLQPNLNAVKNMNVTSASLKVHVAHAYYADSPNGLWLDTVNSSWAPGSLTWNNKPASTNIGKVDVGRGKVATFNVTDAVKSWVNGSKANYGFKLHTNGNGKEYWKKITSTSNSSNKPYLSITYTIPSPSAPTSKTYTNGDGTGHVNLSWNKVTGATGYKIWIYNGKSYESFDVGNVTSWKTEGKKIWPTAAEISAGKFALHTDGKGSELAVDPTSVYRNAGNSTAGKNYSFKVSAVFSQGESGLSAEHKAYVPNMVKPKLSRKSYSNGNGTGYIDLSWSAVSGAKGYKLYLYNGKENEVIDIGNVTSFSTKGKKIWPTAAEIKAGRYKTHLADNSGAELPIDPSPVYKNSGGKYPDSTDYNFKIQAYNDQGETILSSNNLAYIPDLAKPKTPNGIAYTNLKSDNSGYIMMDWDAVEGATGYKIWISNGKTFTSFDVGDVDQWTTQGKGIWPTQAEIDAGKSALHTDGKGAEFAVDPSPVYTNAGSNSPKAKNYYIKLSAYDEDGETVTSSEFKPSIGTPAEFYGEEDYWSILDVPYGKVNAATGNFILSEDDISIDGRGPGLGISRTYNSLSPSTGMFGFGWHSDAEMSIKSAGNQVLFTDDDSTLHIFTKQSDGSYKPPTGVYLELEDKDNDFILTTKDQTKAYFNKSNGKLSKIIDGHNNSTSYAYTDNLLTSITDASGRKLTLEYNADGTVKNILAPDSKKISYSYTSGNLTSFTDVDGAVTNYSYDSNKKLVSVTEPTHTDNKPVINTFVYENNKLTEAQNPRKEKYTIAYNAKRNVLITQPNGRKLSYTYNEAGNPIQYIEDVDGLKLTTNYKYEGNNLIEATDPNDIGSGTPTEQYEYDKDGNIVTAKDSYGTESYSYNKNNDVTSVIDTEGDEVTVAYDGLDAVSETDQNGKTASVAKYDTNGNVVEESYSLGTAENLLSNGSIENGTNNWSLLKNAKSEGTISTEKTSPGKIAGVNSLKVTVKSLSTAGEMGYNAGTQTIDADPNATYTFSAAIKSDLNQANAFLNVEFIDSNGKRIGWTDNRYGQITGKQNWTERQLTFKTPDNTAKIRLYAEVDHRNNSAHGTAWFDKLQVEKAEVSSSFNPIENSSFKANTVWNGTSGTGESLDSTGFADKSALKMTKTSSQAASSYKQTVVLGQSTSDSAFDITLTGISKSNSVSSVKSYAIKAKVTYADNTTGEFTANFPTGTQDWNRAAVKINKSKPINKIEVSAVFQGQGTVWFDDIRLLEGAVVTKNTYDSQGNYGIKSEDEIGNISSATYDTYGNKTSSTDSLGNKRSFVYDKLNQLTKLTLENGTSVDYSYDKNGNMLSKSIVSSAGSAQKFSYEYDVAGKLVKTVGPFGDVTANSYDANSNLIKTITPKGDNIELTYDGTDRISSKSYNGSLAYQFTYDKNGNETSVKYVKDNVTKKSTYDKKDRVIKQEVGNGIQSWKYSETSDKLQEFTFRDNTFEQTNVFSYNKLDQNISMNDGDGTYRFDYDEKGNVKTFISANGAGTTYNYDGTGLVTHLASGTSSGINMLEETITYDANGNRSGIAFADGKNTTYKYGELDQLIEEELVDGTVKQYTYDGFGNRVKVEIIENGISKVLEANFNNYNQLTQYDGDSIKYDENGNRTSDVKYNYQWNEADQLISITKNGENKPFVTYSYDEDDRRMQKVLNGSITNYHYDGDSLNVLYETDSNEVVTKSYTYSENGELVSYKKGSLKYFYHYNAHGDVISITNQKGEQVAAYSYDAWGNTIKAEETPEVKDNSYRYAGYQYDVETGMYYLIARYYNPIQGVFLSADPDPGDDDDILTQNGYSYANNNPVKFVDPDGHWIWMAAGAVIGGVSSYKSAKSRGKKGWRLVGSTLGGAAIGSLGGPAFRGGKILYSSYKAGKVSRTYRTARKVAKSNNGSIKRAKNNNGWKVTTKKHTVRVMKKGSGGRNKNYYRVAHNKKGSMDRYGNYSSDRARTHINLKWNSHKKINRIIRK